MLVTKADSRDEINKNLDKMADIFGLSDDENLGLINKISEAIGGKAVVKPVDWIPEQAKELPADFSGCEPEPSPRNRSTKDSPFPLNLSCIETRKSPHENLVSTERGRIVVEKKLQVLKGKKAKRI